MRSELGDVELDKVGVYALQVVYGNACTDFRHLVAEVRIAAEACGLENHEQIHSYGSAVGAVRRLAWELLERKGKQ